MPKYEKITAVRRDTEAEPTIVVVSFNTQSLLRECLQSVRRAEGGARRCTVVVDNASSDGSVAVVQREFPNIRLMSNEENRGFAAANNQAMASARGRYVLLLNSDTVVLGDVLQKSVEYMDAHPDVGAMGCRVLNPDGSLQLSAFMYPSLLNLLLLTVGVEDRSSPRFCGRRKILDWDRTSERDVDVIAGCYLIVRREVIEQVGMLDESFFFYGEETDWCRRIREAGWKVRFAPVGEIIHHGNASARQLNSRRDVLLTQALVRLHRKHGGIIAAAAAWAILFAFNVSRALGWSALGLLRRSEQTLERGRHFRAVVRSFVETWPRVSVSK